MSVKQDAQGGSLHLAKPDPVPMPASEKVPACDRSSSFVNQLLQSRSDSTIFRYSTPSVHELPSQAQSTPDIRLSLMETDSPGHYLPGNTAGHANGTSSEPKTTKPATTPEQRTLLSWLSSSKQYPRAEVGKAAAKAKDGGLREIAEDIEKTTGKDMKSKPATTGRRELENQRDITTTREVELPASQPDPAGPATAVANMFMFKAGASSTPETKQPAPFRSSQTGPQWKPSLNMFSKDNGPLSSGSEDFLPFSTPATTDSTLASQPKIPGRPIHNDTTRTANALSRPASSYPSSGTKQFLIPASNPTIRPSSAPLVASKSPLPEIRLGHTDADKDFKDGLDHVTSSTRPSNPLAIMDTSTSPSERDDSSFRSASLLEDDSDSDPESQDDSLALVLGGPSPITYRGSVSSDLICTSPPGGLNVIWQWIPGERRDKYVHPFFSIAHQLCRDLTDKEVSPGYIYAFKAIDPQGCDYIKIGVTKALNRRMKTHFGCYGDYERIYPPKGEVPALVKHGQRVESLVHAELVAQSMYLQMCPRARQIHKCHREWFDVEPRHVIDVIRKWSKWMDGGPYVEGSVPVAKPRRRKSAGGAMVKPWHLTALQQDVIMGMCWPLDSCLTATTIDDGDVSDVGRGVRLLTIG